MKPTVDRVLWPGKRVELEKGIVATVYPFGVAHLRAFSLQIAQFVSLMSNVTVKPGDDVAAKMQYLSKAVPHALSELFGLIEACTELEPKGRTLSELPNWLLPAIAKAWLIENFGDDEKGTPKWHPWVAVAQDALEAMTGEKHPILETISKTLSRPGTDSKTSSTAKQESPESLTPAGAGPS